MKNMKELKNDLVRNYADYPQIFGLTQDEVIEVMEAVQDYSNPKEGEKDSQSYKDWCKMYSGIHSEWEHDIKLRNWLACMRWIQSKMNSEPAAQECDASKAT